MLWLDVGQPMAWFGAFAVPFAMYVPASLAGALSTRLIAGNDPIIATVGNALMTGAFAVLLTGVLGHGFGFIFALWSITGLIAVALACQVRSRCTVASHPAAICEVLHVHLPRVVAWAPVRALGGQDCRTYLHWVQASCQNQI